MSELTVKNETRIKQLRIEQNHSQAEVAKAIGVNLRTYQRWESGDANIRQRNANELAKYFKVPLGYLLGYDVDFLKNDKIADLDWVYDFFSDSLSEKQIEKLRSKISDTEFLKHNDYIHSLNPENDFLSFLNSARGDYFNLNLKFTLLDDDEKDIFLTLLEKLTNQ
ncbi:helix-turn-helix domain-containing protein [Streptococcus saliviloxodontae]|uniref:Transcriptional regulator with XRE-family HTH domain n=1 Tax=Streptococcus saliviloxodontae TaxID=1349416 RepID=A0ABS2PLB3_9STRE|nr:helix-turn-helix transcriptional regulator [Streptococcus saliviloxodontae]MBM7636233.1 transcriptional regulator with XRE-family HTH domain [Streptococcus saliviloxodontae]